MLAPVATRRDPPGTRGHTGIIWTRQPAWKERFCPSPYRLGRRAYRPDVASGRLEPAHCGIEPATGVWDKSRNRLAGPVRRLTIEATYPI